MKIDVSLLLYFVAVAEELSFRKAADRLNIAQPWLSRQIKNLENQLGFELFSRTTRNVDLTEKGRRLLERARMMAREVEATRALAGILHREKPDKLRFGVPFFGLYVRERMKLFDVFHTKYPNVKLEICTGSGPQLIADMMDGDLDATFSAGPVDEDGMEVLTLSEKKNEILLAPEDPLVERQNLSISDVAGRNVAVFPRELNNRLYDALFGVFENKSSKFLEFTNLSYTHHLSEHKAVTMIPGWSSGQNFVGVRRQLHNFTCTTKFQILRRRYAHSGPLEEFWRMAGEIAESGLASEQRAAKGDSRLVGIRTTSPTPSPALRRPRPVT